MKNKITIYLTKINYIAFVKYVKKMKQTEVSKVSKYVGKYVLNICF